jgi:hypothetical protein
MLALVIFTLAYSGSANAAPDGQAFTPQISMANVTAIASGEVTVLGANFTPGGDVFIAIYDRWGAETYETRWTTASDNTFAANGSSDPALGFHPGGVVFETFDHLCEQTAMVRAYDQQTATWSNLMDIDTDCSS